MLNPTEKIIKATGEILIPRNINLIESLGNISELLHLTPSDFRTILHQGELGLFFLVLKIDETCLDAYTQIELFALFKKLQIDLSLKCLVHKEQNKDKSIVSYKYQETNGKYINTSTKTPLFPNFISEDSGTLHHIYDDPDDSIIKQMYYIKSEEIFIYLIQYPISIEREFILMNLKLECNCRISTIKDYSGIFSSELTNSSVKELISKRGDQTLIMETYLRKNITVIFPLILLNTYPLCLDENHYLISMSIRNETSQFDYEDRGLRGSIFVDDSSAKTSILTEHPLSGIKISINNLQLFINNSVVFADDTKTQLNGEAMRLLRDGMAEQFQIHIIGNEDVPIELGAQEEASFTVQISIQPLSQLEEHFICKTPTIIKCNKCLQTEQSNIKRQEEAKTSPVRMKEGESKQFISAANIIDYFPSPTGSTGDLGSASVLKALPKARSPDIESKCPQCLSIMMEKITGDIRTPFYLEFTCNCHTLGGGLLFQGTLDWRILKTPPLSVSLQSRSSSWVIGEVDQIILTAKSNSLVELSLTLYTHPNLLEEQITNIPMSAGPQPFLFHNNAINLGKISYGEEKSIVLDVECLSVGLHHVKGLFFIDAFTSNVFSINIPFQLYATQSP